MGSIKKNSVKITKKGWGLLILSSWIVGAIIFSIFNIVPKEYTTNVWLSSIGFLLVGIGFGLAYARVFKIEGIDK